MATYIMLANWTDQGARQVKDSPKRVDAAKKALLEMGGDVDDKSGADGRVGGGGEDFEGAVRFALEGQLLEAGEEATFITKGRGVVMVGVASFPVWEDDGFGTEFANYGG